MTYTEWSKECNMENSIKELCQKAYHAGEQASFDYSLKAINDRDAIIDFLKRELQKKAYCRQVMKRQYRELKMKYEALKRKLDGKEKSNSEN